MTIPQRTRSPLPRTEARQHYVELGSRAVLDQIREDSRALDARAIAIGPFARLDAGRVAAQVGKTRGVLSNLFGSQAAYQVATMEMVLDAGSRLEEIVYPAPADFPTADAWLDAFLAGQSARGPMHGAEPEASYAFLWTLWLATLPYGVWSERVAGPSMEEYVHWTGQIASVVADALTHFGLALRDKVTPADVAHALASVIEGAWLNQLLAATHPGRPDEPASALLLRSGRLVWHGAIRPA